MNDQHASKLVVNYLAYNFNFEAFNVLVQFITTTVFINYFDYKVVCNTQVMVTVTDENDNAPTFTQSQYLIHVPDPMAPGMCLSLPLSFVNFLSFNIKYLSSILKVHFSVLSQLISLPSSV